MPHDVFVSHSTKDKMAADAVVAHLERDGLRCWCAPRDIQPGTSWASAIMEAIVNSKVMVVVFSHNANESDHIRREVERAVGHGVPVVPVRIEDVMPAGDLEYFLSASHWMDAITAPVEQHFDSLASKIKSFVDAPSPKKGAPARSAVTQASPARSNIVRNAIAAIAAFVVLGGVGYWTGTRSAKMPADAPTKAASSSSESAARVPDSGHAMPAPVPNPNPIPAPTPNPVPAPRPNPAGPVLTVVDDENAWRALWPLKSENSFFLDNGPKRFADWKRAAESGNATAQFFVACCYAQGAGVPADDVTANEWLQKSVDAGNADAMVVLGNRTLLGLGTPSDPFKWNELERRAVAKGSPAGMLSLGGGLIIGAQPSDRPEGLRLLHRAASGGSLDARLFLAFNENLMPQQVAIEMNRLAQLNQPDALLFVANASPSDPKKVAAAMAAMHQFGSPLPMELLIDPPPFYPLNTTKMFTAAAWKRLHEMADGGYTDAQRTLDRLKAKGIADPTGR